MNNGLQNEKIGHYYAKLMSYIEPFRVKDQNAKYTHISWGGLIAGKFNIKGKALSKFNKLHKQYCDSGAESNIHQVPQQYMYINLDLDFVVDDDTWKNKYSSKRLYTTSLIEKTLKYYNEAITHYLDVPKNKLEAFVFEKDHPTVKEENVKDGFHVVYPFICARTEVRHLLRSYVLKHIEKEKEFTKFKYKCDKILDESIIESNPWPLYGSTKPGGQIYKLTKIFNHKIEKNDISKYTEDDLVDLMNFFRFSEDDEDILAKGINDDTVTNEFKKLKPVKHSNTINILGNQEQKARALCLVSMLSKSRSDNYSDWIAVGLALHSICQSLLQVWIDFSKQSKKFKKGECPKMWESIKNKEGGLTIRSLEYWAKLDNYDKYMVFVNNELNTKLERSLGGDEYSVADSVYTKYKDKYVCSSVRNDTWWEYCDHRWDEVEKGITLYLKMANDFINHYHTLAADYHNKASQCEGVEKNEYLAKATITTKLANKLMSTGFRERVMKDLRVLFYINKFEDQLNSLTHLIGFNNGIYDLDKGEFRNGQPEDYISMSTGVDYVQYDPTCDISKKICKFFEQVQPNDDMRKYLLTVLASALDGKISDEKFYIFTGCGSNGKSVTIELFTKAIGEYAKPLPSQLLTKKRNQSNAASPEIYQIKGRRAGFFQETEDGDKLHVGQMKEFTGGDEIQARPLFKDVVTFRPQITLFLICNNLPDVPARDKGTWRRIRVANFASEFVADPCKPNQFKIDQNLKQELEQWAPVFVSYLIDIYNTEYKVNGIHEPDDVTGETNRYKQDNDKFMEFFTEEYEITGNEKHRMSIMEAWTNFRTWFKDAYPNTKPPNRTELTNFLKGTIGDPVQGKKIQWAGVLKKMDASDDEDDIPHGKVNNKKANILDA
jgi:P4 family phage/plasmid primase-like protien